MVKLPPDEDTPEKRVDKIFRMMDHNKDHKLTFDEFKEGSKQDPTIVQALSLYDGLVWQRAWLPVSWMFFAYSPAISPPDSSLHLRTKPKTRSRGAPTIAHSSWHTSETCHIKLLNAQTNMKINLKHGLNSFYTNHAMNFFIASAALITAYSSFLVAIPRSAYLHSFLLSPNRSG